MRLPVVKLLVVLTLLFLIFLFIFSFFPAVTGLEYKCPGWWQEQAPKLLNLLRKATLISLSKMGSSCSEMLSWVIIRNLQYCLNSDILTYKSKFISWMNLRSSESNSFVLIPTIVEMYLFLCKITSSLYFIANTTLTEQSR